MFCCNVAKPIETSFKVVFVFCYLWDYTAFSEHLSEINQCVVARLQYKSYNINAVISKIQLALVFVDVKRK